MHMITAKAVAFGEALQPSFKAYASQVVANAKALAEALVEHGYRLCTGGTDNHLLLVDLQPRSAELTGADAEAWLEQAGIVTNKNGIPNDPRPPMVTSGLRLGTAALTTRRLDQSHMREIAAMLDRVLDAQGDPAVAAEVKGQVKAMCHAHPLPH
jgi:glycine hydroxymethyltransferase